MGPFALLPAHPRRYLTSCRLCRTSPYCGRALLNVPSLLKETRMLEKPCLLVLLYLPTVASLLKGTRLMREPNLLKSLYL